MNYKERIKIERLKKLKAKYTAETGRTEDDLHYILWLQNELSAVIEEHIK